MIDTQMFDTFEHMGVYVVDVPDIPSCKATQTKAMFLSNMSHDMRTPMNAVIGLSNHTSDS